MNPNQPYQSQLPQPPIGPTTSGGPYGIVPPSPSSNTSTEPRSNSRFILPLCIIAALELLVVVGLLIALASSHKASTPTKSAGSNSLSQDPQPATSLGVQQTSDAMSQDITPLDANTSFPATALDDKTLSL